MESWHLQHFILSPFDGLQDYQNPLWKRRGSLRWNKTYWTQRLKVESLCGFMVRRADGDHSLLVTSLSFIDSSLALFLLSRTSPSTCHPTISWYTITPIMDPRKGAKMGTKNQHCLVLLKTRGETFVSVYWSLFQTNADQLESNASWFMMYLISSCYGF